MLPAGDTADLCGFYLKVTFCDTFEHYVRRSARHFSPPGSGNRGLLAGYSCCDDARDRCLEEWCYAAKIRCKRHHRRVL